MLSKKILEKVLEKFENPRYFFICDCIKYISDDLGFLYNFIKVNYQYYRIHKINEYYIEIKKSKSSKTLWIPKSMISDNILIFPKNGFTLDLTYKIELIKSNKWYRFLFNFNLL